jgi:putative acetyltransferase
MTKIRVEEARDVSQVRAVNELAFGQPAEADVVDKLRGVCDDYLALVADDDGIVGQIVFTPAVVEQPGHSVVGMGLAPLAVLPDRQRRGIGSALVRRGLEILRERDCPFVIVLGHPDYYPRLGFERTSAHGLTCQWEGIPDEAFRVLILDADAMKRVSGVAAYRDEFNDAI